MTKISYSGYRFPPEAHPTSDLALSQVHGQFWGRRGPARERGVVVSYETVRRWVNHFGPLIAAELRKRRPTPHSVWHLDEVYPRIKGEIAYLWRAVDAEAEVLDVLLQPERNKHAALKLMRKILKKYAMTPDWLVTDDLRSYRAAACELGIEDRLARKR